MSRFLVAMICGLGLGTTALFQSAAPEKPALLTSINPVQDQDEDDEMDEQDEGDEKGEQDEGEEKGEGTALDEKDVPKAVKKAAAKLAGKDQKLSFSKEEEWGATVYSTKWAVGKIGHEVVLAADGSLIETENEIGLDDLPAAVQKQIAKMFPKGAELKIERKVITVYEVETMIDGKEKMTLFAATGAPVEVDADDEQAEDADGDDEDEEGEADDDGDGKKNKGDDDDDDDEEKEKAGKKGKVGKDDDDDGQI